MTATRSIENLFEGEPNFDNLATGPVFDCAPQETPTEWNEPRA